MHGKKKIIRLSKSCLSTLEKVSVKKVLDKEFLGMGPEVQKFEKELSRFFKRDVVCFNSGTAALHVALQSAEVGLKDEVLVPILMCIIFKFINNILGHFEWGLAKAKFKYFFSFSF